MNFTFEWQEEGKIHIFQVTCNFLVVIWTISIHGRDWKAGFITNTGYYLIQTKKGGNRDVIAQYGTTRVTYEKYATQFPDVVVILIPREF